MIWVAIALFALCFTPLPDLTAQALHRWTMRRLGKNRVLYAVSVERVAGTLGDAYRVEVAADNPSAAMARAITEREREIHRHGRVVRSKGEARRGRR